MSESDATPEQIAEHLKGMIVHSSNGDAAAIGTMMDMASDVIDALIAHIDIKDKAIANAADVIANLAAVIEAFNPAPTKDQRERQRRAVACAVSWMRENHKW